MAVPKKKTSKRRSANRTAANNKTALPTLTKCPQCGEFKKPHIACSFCGYYGGKKVLNVESALDKKLRKASNSAKASQDKGKNEQSKDNKENQGTETK